MPAKVITVFNQKGGVGKTTISMQLAGCLADRGAKVLVIDLDSQGTAVHWAKQAPDSRLFPARVINLANMGSKAHREIAAYAEDYDFIIVDCPPSVYSPAPSSAMLVSDLALIPVIPAPADMWATTSAKHLVETVRQINEGLQVRIIPSMVQANTNLSRDTLELLQEDPDIPATRSRLGFRVAYRECQLIGGTVRQLPDADTAVSEIDQLADEVLEVLKVEIRGRKRKGSERLKK